MVILWGLLSLLCFRLLLLVKGQGNGMQSCITNTPDLTVITPSDSNYSTASQPFNLRLTPSPVVIAYPSTPDEVSNIVECAASSGMNISVRSGGHSYAAYGLSGNVVIDLRNLKNLTVDSSGKAISQTGVLLGELAEGLWNQGQRALPHGSCPYVGTGGHALYGGFGYYSRAAGLLLDRIISAEVVLANGSIVTASNTSNTDLFWALRGAGPSFGVVTSWTFDTLPAPPTTVSYQITFPELNQDDMTSAIVVWQQFGATAPNELAMQAVLGPTGSGGGSGSISLEFQGSYYGELAQFNSTIGNLLSNLPSSAKLDATGLGWMEGLAASDGDLNTSQPEMSNTFFAKSLVTTEPSQNDSIAAWVKYLFGPGISTNITWFAEIDLYGGAVASVPANATAFAHRNAFTVYQLYANTPNKLPPFPSDGIAFVDDMLNALESDPKAAYPNYIDPTLTPDQWQSLYFADHMARLEQIKREVDPNNLFNFQQAIPPALSSSNTSSSPTTGSNTNGTAPSRKSSAAWKYPVPGLFMIAMFIFVDNWIAF